MKTIFISVLLSLMASMLCSQTLTIKISGIENTNGKLSLAFFTCEQEYKSEKPKISRSISKQNLQNGTITIEYRDIPQGRYGIAVLDDENQNGKMDYSFFVPVEGFGFSNYSQTGLSKPNYNNFCFTLGSNSKTIIIKMRYL